MDSRGAWSIDRRKRTAFVWVWSTKKWALTAIRTSSQNGARELVLQDRPWWEVSSVGVISIARNDSNNSC